MSDVEAAARGSLVGSSGRSGTRSATSAGSLAERARLEGRRRALVVLLAVQAAVGKRIGQQAVDDIAVGVGGAQRRHSGVTRVVLEGRPQVT